MSTRAPIAAGDDGTIIDLPDLPDLPGRLPDLPNLPAIGLPRIGNPITALTDATSEGIGRLVEVLIDVAGNLVLALAGVGLMVLGVRRIFGG